MKTPTTDRRLHERFDVLGSLWGVLELPETASIVNASSSGLLIEANVCPVLDSVHSTDIQIGGAGVRVDSVVRHLQPSEDGKFRIGLEFVEPPTTIDNAIEHLTPRKNTKGPSSDES
ncbi:MAG: PilZ domain-containing protein [Vicinamibacterales bacterium]